MRKTILWYALPLAFAAFAVEWVERLYAGGALPTASYIGLLAGGFVALGLWAGIRLAGRVARPRRAPDEAGIRAAGLSPREREVLDLLAGGLSVKEIARALAISPTTVKTHVTRVYEKLEVRRRLHAVDKARALGLIA